MPSAGSTNEARLPSKPLTLRQLGWRISRATDPVGVMHDRLADLLVTRPAAHVVGVVEGDPEATYRLVLGALDQ